MAPLILIVLATAIVIAFAFIATNATRAPDGGTQNVVPKPPKPDGGTQNVVPQPPKPELFMTGEDHALIWQLAMTGADVIPFGSRFCCNPAPTTSDFDYAVEGTSDVRKLLAKNGFQYNNDYNGMFRSYRRGALNIVTFPALYTERVRLAAEECKERNLLDRKDRIEVFERVVYTRHVKYGSVPSWADSYHLPTSLQSGAANYFRGKPIDAATQEAVMQQMAQQMAQRTAHVQQAVSRLTQQDTAELKRWADQHRAAAKASRWPL